MGRSRKPVYPRGYRRFESSRFRSLNMSKETPKFKPDLTEKIKQEQLGVLEEAQKRIENGEVPGKVNLDLQFFLITVPLKTGKEITECLPRNFDPIALKDADPVSISDAIEAVQKFYPEMEEPNLKEAVRRLRESKPKK